MARKDLAQAKDAKKDEFYTQLTDIEKELRHYTEHFRDKVVFCNCDDPYESNFFKYFALMFNKLGLKKLIATCYNGSPVSGNELLLDFGDTVDDPKKIAYKVEISEVTDTNGDGAINLSDIQYLMQNDKNIISVLKGNGDFRSDECIELLKQADIVVTNPPFSLFREYLAQLVKYEKQFLIIGNQNAITYKEVFPLIKDNKLWLGLTMNSSNRWFQVPDSYEKYHKIENGKKYAFVAGVVWWTNLNHNRRNEPLMLYKNYTPEEYPHYDNYDAINVNDVKDIPLNFDGVMGVPISFLHKYNPEQFEIIKFRKGDDEKDLSINGKCPYFRILIRKNTNTMQIELHEITIRELANGYQDNAEGGVVAFGGKLDVRPPYQREFVYKDKQRDAVITTVNQGFPLNVMYWADKGDGTYEVIDGQQRTISICQYVNGDFSYNLSYFHSLPSDQREKFLDYKLMVYICTGTDSEKLGWFKTINIAGEKLTDQELRNAVYCGSWVNAAKVCFSKNGCVAYKLASDYLNGSCIRQDYLETAISWISKGRIEEYMSKHQNDPNANELWLYFTTVINWVQTVFPTKRKEMKGQDWGALYDQFHNQAWDTAALEQEIARLMKDSDVSNKRGIYPYVLDRKEHHLNIRAFDDNTRREIYEKQMGICPHCGKHFDIEFMEADHITPWSKGGRTVAENCQMLCQECNRRKSAK